VSAPLSDPPATSAEPIAAPPADRIAASPGARRRRLLSDVWLKVIMAVTGFIFAAFVVVHMIGNLKIYTGPLHFDTYAHWLRTLFEPLLPYEGMLWIFRVVLALCLIGHVWCAFLLTMRSNKARGRFSRKALKASSWATKLMLITGILLLLFIVFHILDLTVGLAPMAPAEFQPATGTTSAAYNNVVASFSRWPVAIFYSAVMVALALHLAHGLVSMVSDLGGGGATTRKVMSIVAGVIALVVLIANASIPMAVLAGVITS
jgi:succinate dehydrogenase / fumarate reductase cytochrome b subunit